MTRKKVSHAISSPAASSTLLGDINFKGREKVQRLAVLISFPEIPNSIPSTHLVIPFFLNTGYPLFYISHSHIKLILNLCAQCRHSAHCHPGTLEGLRLGPSMALTRLSLYWEVSSQRTELYAWTDKTGESPSEQMHLSPELTKDSWSLILFSKWLFSCQEKCSLAVWTDIVSEL